MEGRRRLVLLVVLGVLGIGLYFLALAVPHHLHFWTDRTLRSQVPWKYIGRTWVRGVCATIALLLTVGLGLGCGEARLRGSGCGDEHSRSWAREE